MTKLSQLIYQPITLLGISFVSLLFFLSLLKTTQHTQSFVQNTENLKNQITQDSAENQALHDSLDTAQTPLAQEKTFRNELLMKSSGEYIVQISDEALKQSQNLKNDTKISQKTPWEEWQKLLLKI